MKTINGAKDVYELVREPLFGEEQEYCIAITCNLANNLIAVNWLTAGTDKAVHISPKMIARKAILDNATGVVIVHNHPSGDVNPSKEDIVQTTKLRDALNLFDICLMDHVIVADKSYFSFADDRVTNE